jgi:hypothetical protein
VALVLVSAACVSQVEQHLFVQMTRISAESLGYHFGNEGILTCGFGKAQLGVFLFQPSPCYGQGTQYPSMSLPIAWGEVS